MTWKFLSGLGLALFAGILFGELLVELALKLGGRRPRRF